MGRTEESEEISKAFVKLLTEAMQAKGYETPDQRELDCLFPHDEKVRFFEKGNIAFVCYHHVSTSKEGRWGVAQPTWNRLREACRLYRSQPGEACLFVALVSRSPQQGFCFVEDKAQRLIRNERWKVEGNRKKDYKIAQTKFSGYDAQDQPFDFSDIKSLVSWLTSSRPRSSQESGIPVPQQRTPDSSLDWRLLLP